MTNTTGGAPDPQNRFSGIAHFWNGSNDYLLLAAKDGGRCNEMSADGADVYSSSDLGLTWTKISTQLLVGNRFTTSQVSIVDDPGGPYHGFHFLVRDLCNPSNIRLYSGTDPAQISLTREFGAAGCNSLSGGFNYRYDNFVINRFGRVYVSGVPEMYCSQITPNGCLDVPLHYLELGPTVYSHDDLNTFVVLDGTTAGQERIIVGHDGGASYRDMSGTWHDLNGTSWPTIMASHLGVDEFGKQMILGSIDNGTWRIYPGVAEWEYDGAKSDGGMSRAYRSKDGQVNAWSSVRNATSRLTVNISGQQALRTHTVPNNDFRLDWPSVMRLRNGEPTLFFTHGTGSQGGIFRMDRNGPAVLLTPGPEAIWSYNCSALDVHPSNPDFILYAIYSKYWGAQEAPYRILRSASGGVSWSDLTQNLTNPNSPESDQNVFSRYGVSTIAIDPDSDPDYIDQMVVYAGIARVPEQDGFERVFKSTNGGQTWVDISAGLPGFPVNYLACQPGSGGVVYAATDVGVFVYKPDLGQWECFNADLPISIVTGLEVNMCTGKLYASTYGRSIWQTDLYFPPSLPLRVISATTSIGDIVTAQTVRVAAGSTLTINGTWEFRPRASLIIEQGAKVVVDGGTLTSRCPTFWCGVQVWGTADQHQSPESHPTCQGPLVLKNGALVENAHEAFTNWKPGDWNTRGGVIQVQGTPASTGATFRNCRRSAGFMAYQNFLSSNPAIKLNDASYFNYARFLWDDACFNGINTYAHVTLWGVNGLRFRACSFENNQLTTPAHTSSKLGKGIYSEDASYSVTGKCQQLLQLGMPCPEQYLDRSHFIGLDHGISALGAGGSRSFTVLDSDFDDNICGVYANGVLSYQVQNNRFRMGGRTVPLDGLVDARFQGRHRALFSTESWAFAVDDNTVEQDGAYTLTEGIVIGYSRDHNDIVFRNQATGLERGFIGEGIAADLTPGYTGLRGLQFLCNTNSNNTQDSWSRLVTDDDQLLQPFHTIRTNQGNSYRPADNTFDQVPGPEGVGDFKVTTENGNIT